MSGEACQPTRAARLTASSVGDLELPGRRQRQAGKATRKTSQAKVQQKAQQCPKGKIKQKGKCVEAEGEEA